MRPRFEWILLAGLFLAACSGPDGAGEDPPRAAAGRAAPHDMAAMPDTAPPKAHSDPGGMAEMRHSAGSAMEHGPSTGAPAAAAGVDHSRMRMGPGSGGAAPMDHSRMQTGGARSGSMPPMDHSRMSPAGPAARPAMAAMDHARMTGTRPAAGQQSVRRMGGMDHAGMSMPAAPPSQPRHEDRADSTGIGAHGPDQTDPATEKLRLLVVELVRDPVVLARIEADPALRRAWEDEGVRRALLEGR